MENVLMQLVSPLGMTFVLVVGTGVWGLVKGRRRWAVWWLGWGAVLWVTGATPLPAWLLSRLEAPYVGMRVEEVPEADVVVMLGGVAREAPAGVFGMDFQSSVDRALMVGELVRLGKAPELVLGGGRTRREEEAPLENELVEPWLRAWGSTPGRVHRLEGCGNTHDEALACARLAGERGWRRVILVTSAWHMRRAEATFRKAGLEVTPVGTDFRGSAKMLGARFGVLPGPGGLLDWDVWLHEVVGWWVYRWRGWLE